MYEKLRRWIIYHLLIREYETHGITKYTYEFGNYNLFFNKEQSNQDE